MRLPLSFVLATFLSTLCNSQDYSLWTKINVLDFPTDPIISSTFALNIVLCSVQANRNNLCNLYCFDIASLSCAMYRQPVIIKPPYVCSSDLSCDQGTVSCYQKAAVGDVFLGQDIQPFSGAALDSGGVRARNIHNIPMDRRWKWPLPKGKVLKITIKFLNLGPCCTCAFLEVRSFKTGAKFGGPYCGAPAVPFSIIVPTNNAELRLFSDGSSVLEGFELTYESIEAYACDPTIVDVTDPQGEIVVRNSVAYPMTCVWKMAMPVGTMLRITFVEFNLGACCACAYISILDNEFTYMPISGSTICGPTIPERLPGTISNSLDITFYTDGSAQLPGFKIQYEAIPQPTRTGCTSGIALTESHGLLRPSVPPALYTVSTTCSWNIQLAAGSKIGFFFLWISTEVNFDLVTVKDELTGTILGGGPISGEPKVPILEASGNKASVKFVTDHNINLRGFALYYFTV